MARPQYLIKKDDEEIVVKSKDLAMHQKDGWVVVETIRGDVRTKIETQEPEQIETPKQEVLDPQFKPEQKIQNQEPEEIEIKPEPKKQTKKKKTDDVSSELPDDLKCPVCGVKARTKQSFLNNHGDNCARAVGSKKSKKSS